MSETYKDANANLLAAIGHLHFSACVEHAVNIASESVNQSDAMFAILVESYRIRKWLNCCGRSRRSVDLLRDYHCTCREAVSRYVHVDREAREGLKD